MTHKDIYIKFMIGYDKANVSSSYPSLTEYEIATFLDKAYLALIAQKVTGNNSRHIGFEQDLKVTEDLGPLIVTKRIFNINSNPLSYVHNALSCTLPPDWLYFVSGELKRVNQSETKTWDVSLISHLTAIKFYTTAYNIPWIKRPVGYIEGSKFYTLYDSVQQALGVPTISLTYIKQPKKFMVDDEQGYSSSEDILPSIFSSSGYRTGQTVNIKVRDQITLYCRQGSKGHLLLSDQADLFDISEIASETYDKIITLTAQEVGQGRFIVTNDLFSDWSYELYFIISENTSGESAIYPEVSSSGPIYLTVGDSHVIDCYYPDHHAIPNIVPQSSDGSVIRINATSMTNGPDAHVIVSAIGVGRSTVTLTSINHPYWYRIVEYVVQQNASDVEDRSILWSPRTITSTGYNYLTVDSDPVTITFRYYNASGVPTMSGNSSDNSVIEITNNDNQVTITPIAAGSATVTVTSSSDAEYLLTFRFNVSAPQQGGEQTIEGLQEYSGQSGIFAYLKVENAVLDNLAGAYTTNPLIYIDNNNAVYCVSSDGSVGGYIIEYNENTDSLHNGNGITGAYNRARNITNAVVSLNSSLTSAQSPYLNDNDTNSIATPLCYIDGSTLATDGIHVRLDYY